MINEKYPNFAKKATIDAHASISMRQRLETLSIHREVWETTQLEGSNAGLYQIMDEGLALYRDLTSGENVRSMKQGLNDYISIKGYVFKSSSPLTLKVIHCIFGAKDRERGGIQEISLKRKESLKPKERAAFAREVLMQQSIATLSSDALKTKMNIEHIHENAVAVLTLNGDGTYSVHCVVKSNAAVDAALAAYFSQNKLEVEIYQNQRNVEAEAYTRAKLIGDAVNSANDSMIHEAA